jgi:hypothetical protein
MKGNDVARRLLSWGVGVMRRMGKFSKDTRDLRTEPTSPFPSQLPVPGSPVPLQRYPCKVVSAPNSERAPSFVACCGGFGTGGPVALRNSVASLWRFAGCERRDLGGLVAVIS